MKNSKKQKNQNKLIVKLKKLLAVLGFSATIGGVAALGTGVINPQPKSPQETTEDITKDKNNEKSKKETYMDGIKVDIAPEQPRINSNEKTEDIVDKILEEYNNNLEELGQTKITKENLGCILQSTVGDGRVIEETMENGEKLYTEDPRQSGILPENKKWISAEEIGDVYVLVDTNSNSIISSTGEINNEIQEIMPKYLEFGGKEYNIDEQTYVGIPDSDIQKTKTDNLKETYKDFKKYYNDRVKAQENDGWEH